MKLHIIPAEKIKKKKRKARKKFNSTIFGLRRCIKCLQTKTLPNFDGDSFVCDLCSRGIDVRSYSDYIQEAIEYDDWKSKYPNIKPCHRCRGFYPPYVTSIEEGKTTCANCFLIIEEEEKNADRKERSARIG